jgi:hypothetical protein
MSKALGLFSLLFLFALTQSANADDSCPLKVQKTDSKVILTAPTCASLNSEISALQKWRIQGGETAGSSPVVTPNANGSCSADISNTAPSVVQSLQDTYSSGEGPNCWNLALYSSQSDPDLRYVSPQEFTDYLNSSLCSPIKAGEAPQPGDVGAIRSRYEDDNNTYEVHGFIYVSDQLAFSKNSLETKDGYELQCKENFFSEYAVDEKTSSACMNSSLGSISNCSSWVDYYHCKSMDEFVKENNNEFSSAEKSAENQVNALDQYVSCMVVTQPQAQTPIVNAVTSIADVLKKYIQDEKAKLPQSAPYAQSQRDQIFLLSTLEDRVQSMEKQLVIYF